MGLKILQGLPFLDNNERIVSDQGLWRASVRHVDRRHVAHASLLGMDRWHDCLEVPQHSFALPRLGRHNGEDVDQCRLLFASQLVAGASRATCFRTQGSRPADRIPRSWQCTIRIALDMGEALAKYPARWCRAAGLLPWLGPMGSRSSKRVSPTPARRASGRPVDAGPLQSLAPERPPKAGPQGDAPHDPEHGVQAGDNRHRLPAVRAHVGACR